VVLGREFGGRFFENFKSRENVESILRQQGVYGDTTNVDEELIEILLGPSEDDGAQEVFLNVFAGPPGPTPESLLPNIACPILALWGTADPWTPIDAGSHPGTSFSNFTDNYTLIPLEGAGHCPHDECPDEVNSKMIEWLAGLEQK
jgi:non-heme chloroperoxidase